jgi:hypothetical protein
MRFKAEYTQAEFRNAVGAAYKLGIQDGEQRRDELLALALKTNRCLWRELQRMDKNQPVAGVLIPYDLVDMFDKALTEHNQIRVRGMLRACAQSSEPSDEDVEGCLLGIEQ